MTEVEAQDWIGKRWPSSMAALTKLVELVRDENASQNLIAASTLDAIWVRHVADSAQLAVLAGEDRAGVWVDVGTGGGFPGLVCAILRPGPVWLVEPRRRRAAFLERAVAELGLTNRVTVHASRVERITGTAGVISARAVATITELLTMCRQLIAPDTVIVLPRGAIDHADVAVARTSWNMMFHVEPSITDPTSQIAIIAGLRPR